MMEALWVHQWHNRVDEKLLARMLKSSDPWARAAATRVLCYWRDRVANPLALAQDARHRRASGVRLEAVRAASFFQTAEAAEVALASLAQPQDRFLEVHARPDDEHAEAVRPVRFSYARVVRCALRARGGGPLMALRSARTGCSPHPARPAGSRRRIPAGAPDKRRAHARRAQGRRQTLPAGLRRAAHAQGARGAVPRRGSGGAR